MTSVSDMGELVAITPAEATSYLRSTGWQETGSYGRATVFTRLMAGDEVEVLLPQSTDLRDYPARMTELLDTLSVVEGRPSGDVLRDLRSPLLDVQYIRTMPDTPSGTTPLDEGFRAIRGVRELYLEAAALALAARDGAETPPAGFTRPKEFLDQVRLGTTTAGSYVLRVETPLNSDGRATEPDVGLRAVLLHLHRVSTAAHAASAESARAGTPRPFESYVGQDVSPKLCGALAKLGGLGKYPFEMRFAWARALPAAQSANLPAELRFDQEQALALNTAVRYLEKLVTPRPATVEGRSSQLTQDNPNAPGRVIIDGKVITDEGTIEDQKISVTLPVAQYDRIVEAHRPARGARVVVRGMLRAAGQRWEFTEVAGVEIVD